jgi:hypothetical protein
MAAQTSTPIIPAPARLRPAIGEFRLVPGTTVAYRDPILAPLVRRFAQDAARRCGIALDVGTGERAGAIVIDLGDDPDFAGLPAPLGLDPAGPPRDERYALTIDRSGIRLRAREPAGVARGLTSLLQLIATATAAPLPALDILDAPRFAWRGLTVDVVRRFFPPAQIRTLIDLAALYKLDVLHLHLTDDQGWRVEAGRPAPMREPDGTFYTDDEVRALVAYAADRFVTLLPEIDTPGHGLALLRLRPELGSGRNLVRPGQPHQSAWLDPELPATFEILDAALAELAGLFPRPVPAYRRRRTVRDAGPGLRRLRPPDQAGRAGPGQAHRGLAGIDPRRRRSRARHPVLDGRLQPRGRRGNPGPARGRGAGDRELPASAHRSRAGPGPRRAGHRVTPGPLLLRRPLRGGAGRSRAAGTP